MQTIISNSRATKPSLLRLSQWIPGFDETSRNCHFTRLTWRLNWRIWNKQAKAGIQFLKVNPANLAKLAALIASYPAQQKKFTRNNGGKTPNTTMLRTSYAEQILYLQFSPGHYGHNSSKGNVHTWDEHWKRTERWPLNYDDMIYSHTVVYHQ